MPTMKEIIMQKLTTFRLSDDTHDRCLSFEHEGYMYTLIDIKDKERADYRRYFQQYFLNAKKAEAIGLPCETMLMKEIPEEALVLRSKYIDHDTNPDWITTKEMFHQIITVPLFDTLKKLHDQGFAHGDFTESNIFLSKSERIFKYADFKHLQKYDTREVYTWNHAKLIDIYDAIQSVLHIAEYSCRDAFGGTSDEEPSDNVLDFLRTQQKILEPIKAAEGDAKQQKVTQTKFLITKHAGKTAQNIMENIKQIEPGIAESDIGAEPPIKKQRPANI